MQDTKLWILWVSVYVFVYYTNKYQVLFSHDMHANMPRSLLALFWFRKKKLISDMKTFLYNAKC